VPNETEIAMSHSEVLRAVGLDAVSVTNGSLIVTSPIDGTAIAQLSQHSGA